MRRLCLAAVTMLAACSSPTGARITVLPAPNAQPTALRLKAYGAGLLGTSTTSLVGKTLPGTLALTNLDAGARDFRVVVDGLAPSGAIVAEGAARVRLARGKVVAATVTLSDGTLPDGDGDGVPDPVDDCPGGDDARPVCSVVPHDLAGADLSAVDLAGPQPDLFGRDLAPAPGDMRASCPAAAFFCEDFENGFTAWSSVEEPNGATTNTMTIDGVHVRSGTHALHVGMHGTSSTPENEISRFYLFNNAISSGTIAVRGFFYFANAPMNVTYFASLDLQQADGPGFKLGADSDLALPGATDWSAFDITPGNRSDSKDPVAAGQTCYEFDYNIGTHQLTLYVNDQQKYQYTESTNPPGSFDRVRLGVTYLTYEANDLWIDDLAVGTAHLGCN